MQNNSNDSAQGWKQKLEEFEDISGNNLDLHTAWEKLQQKRNEPKASTSKKWYWLAAACITALLTLAVMLTGRPVEKIDPAVVKADQPAIEKEHTNYIIQNTPEGLPVRETKKRVKAENKLAALRTAAVTTPEPLLVKEGTNAVPQIVVRVDSIATQPLPVTASAKKLKVVHINELNQTQEGIAKEEGKPYFPITYQTRQVYTTADDNNKKGRDNLIRIKLN